MVCLYYGALAVNFSLTGSYLCILPELHERHNV